MASKQLSSSSDYRRPTIKKKNNKRTEDVLCKNVINMTYNPQNLQKRISMLKVGVLPKVYGSMRA